MIRDYGGASERPIQREMANGSPTARSRALGGALRLTAAGAIAALALLALLVVFEILPREALAEWSTKLLLAGAILAAASAGVAFVLRAGSPPEP